MDILFKSNNSVWSRKFRNKGLGGRWTSPTQPFVSAILPVMPEYFQNSQGIDGIDEFTKKSHNMKLNSRGCCNHGILEMGAKFFPDHTISARSAGRVIRFSNRSR